MLDPFFSQISEWISLLEGLAKIEVGANTEI